MAPKSNRIQKDEIFLFFSGLIYTVAGTVTTPFAHAQGSGHTGGGDTACECWRGSNAARERISHYELSDQITSFLKRTTVLRLAVARKFDLKKVALIDGTRKKDLELEIHLLQMLFDEIPTQMDPTGSYYCLIDYRVRKWLQNGGRRLLLEHLSSNQVESLTLKIPSRPWSLFDSSEEIQIFDTDTRADRAPRRARFQIELILKHSSAWTRAWTLKGSDACLNIRIS